MERIAILSLLASAAVEIVSLIVLPVDGYDAPYHLFWIGAWHVLWQHGILYPRWLPQSFGGLGAPTFYLYPPGAYAFSSLVGFVLPELSVAALAKGFVILTLAASGLTMWLYLRSSGVRGFVAVAGTMLYVFAPYRFLDFNTRSALSEHGAFVFLPLAFWGADRLFYSKHRTHGILLLSISFAFLLLTSLPAAAVMVVVLFSYLLAEPASILHHLASLAFAAVVVILLSAFYLFPMLSYLGDVQLSNIWSAIGLGSPILSILSGKDLRIGAYTMLTFLGAALLVYFFWRRKSDRTGNGKARQEFWMLAAIVILQLPYLPAPLFAHVIPFTIVQQPYRLSMALLVLVVAWWAQDLLQRNDFRGSSVVVAGWSIATIVLVGAQLGGLQVHRHFLIRPNDIHELPTRWMPAPVNDSTSERHDSIKVVPYFSNRSGSVLFYHHANYSDSLTFDERNQSTLHLARTYWPTWSIQEDGHPIAAAPDSVGLLTCAVNPGIHTIVVTLEESSGERIGNEISLASWTVIILVLLVGTEMKRRRTRHRKQINRNA